MPTGTETRLVLVRHGESRATVEQVAGGERGCQGLTDLGARQTEALAQRIRGTAEFGAPTVLLSSTLPRAIETAEILAPALGGLAVVQDRDLCELHPGAGDGMGWAELSATFGAFSFEDEPYRPLAPGGESWAAFMLRVGSTLTRIAEAHEGGTVVAACHGGIVEGSVRCLLSLAWPGAGRVLGICANTSITEWTCRIGDSNRPHWELRRYNDAAHLDERGEPRPVEWG